MKKRTVFSLMLILLPSLLIVSLVDARECVELKYDDGTWEAGWVLSGKEQFGVKFSIPSGWEAANLVMTRFYIMNPHVFEVHVYEINGNELVNFLTVTPTLEGWFDVPLNLEVSSDFIVAMEYVDDDIPGIGVDKSSNQGRSFSRVDASASWDPRSNNLMIHAVVCSIPPVGGELILNTIPTIASWLIAGVSTIAFSLGIVLKKKRLI